MRLSGLTSRKLLGIGTPLLFLLAACGDNGDGDNGEPEAEANVDDGSGGDDTATEQLEDDQCDTDDVSFTATADPAVSDEIAVYAEPDGEELETLPTTWVRDLEDPDVGSPVTFLITDESDPYESPDWYHVSLPVPTEDGDNRGYVRADDVEIGCTPYRITIDLDAFELTLSLEGTDIVTAAVGLGRDERATAPGDYYLTQLIRNANPDDAYGTYAYALNAFADDEDIVAEFDTEGKGYATVGIHGTNDPDTIPGNVSSGCIRLKNEDIVEIKEQAVPLGTPVHVVDSA